MESVGSSKNLLASLAAALDLAIDQAKFRIAVDSKENSFVELRAITQFHVPPELYDWFFNSRAGYRARFWISPEDGTSFNEEIAQALAGVLSRRLPTTVPVRCIEVELQGASRVETDVGARTIPRDVLLRSLTPGASKIWIGERLYGGEAGTITDIGFATLSEAARSPAKLCIPRWAEAAHPTTKEKGEGLRAPFPSPENSWLDLKGGFLNAEGMPGQIKPQDERAKHIHLYGWT